MAPATKARFRPFIASDRRATFDALAPVLSESYPGGDLWLSSRFDQILDGKVRATVLPMECGIGAISIETPKSRARMKLSTFWVHPALRGRRIGTQLLRMSVDRWAIDGVDDAYITCAVEAATSLAPLLHASDFRLAALDRDRYGQGRHEVVFAWQQEETSSNRMRPSWDSLV